MCVGACVVWVDSDLQKLGPAYFTSQGPARKTPTSVTRDILKQQSPG